MLANTDRVANGFAKQILELINCRGLTQDSIGFQTATVSYAPGRSVEQSAYFNRGQVEKHVFAGFVQDHLRPLFLDSSGQALDLDEVKRNFRNINVIAHSFGAAFMQQVGDILFEHMQRAGFSDDAINAAVSQILIVTAGSAVNYMQSKSKFTSIHVLHRHDKRVQEKTANIDLFTSLLPDAKDGAEVNQSGLAAFTCRKGASAWDIRLDPTSNLMIVGTLNPREPDRDRDVIENCQESEPLRKTDDEFNHGVDTYLNLSLQESGFILRSLIASVLTNGLNSSIKNHSTPHLLPAPGELVQLPVDRLFEANDDLDFRKVARIIAYEERIGTMLGKL